MPYNHPVITRIKERIAANPDIKSRELTELLREDMATMSPPDLEYMTEGQTRRVYELNDGKAVLKMAKTGSGGESQNKSEAETYSCTGPKFFAEVYDSDPAGRWLVMERVSTNDGVKTRKLWSWFGKTSRLTDMATLVYAIKRGKVAELIATIENNKESNQAAKDEGIEWVYEFVKITNKCSVNTSDLHSGNVGIRDSTNTLVLIDYADYNLTDDDGMSSESVSLKELIYAGGN